MGLGHWIGGALGFITGTGPLGILAGAVLGGWIEQWWQENSSESEGRAAYSAEEERNGFLFSLLVLSAYVVQADGRIMHSEMEALRRFLRENFGMQAVAEGEEIVRRLFEERKRIENREGEQAYDRLIEASCRELASSMNYGQRLQLLAFLCGLCQADGTVHPQEVAAVKRLARLLGLEEREVDSLLHLGGDSLEAAYAVLGISPSASNEEVRRAYKRLALQHHPDKVASLGEDVRKAAEKKFQEIGAAKERIYKARGMR